MDDLDVVDATRRVPQGFLTGSERTRASPTFSRVLDLEAFCPFGVVG